MPNIDLSFAQEHCNRVKSALKFYLSKLESKHKLGIRKCAQMYKITKSSLGNAFKSFVSKNNEFSRGNGPPTLFSELEEDELKSFIEFKAQHGEPMTTSEFLEYASDMLQNLYPEKLLKSTLTNHRECSPTSGHMESIKQDRQLSYHWFEGFEKRIRQRSGDWFRKVHPSYVEENRAEVNIDDLEKNHRDFYALCNDNGIDINTAGGRRRVLDVDETGISGTKATKKSSNDFVLMPSNCKVKPVRKISSDRGHITALTGGNMRGEMAPTLFIDKSNAACYKGAKTVKGEDTIEQQPVAFTNLLEEEAGGLQHAYKTSSQCGFITARIFNSYLESIVNWAQDLNITLPIILQCDGALAHSGVRNVTDAKEKGTKYSTNIL